MVGVIGVIVFFHVRTVSMQIGSSVMADPIDTDTDVDALGEWRPVHYEVYENYSWMLVPLVSVCE